ALAGGIEGWPDLRPGLSAQITASRSASGNGNVRSNVALIRLKMAVQAPIPSASVSTATAVKPGFFSNWRKANLRSFIFTIFDLRFASEQNTQSRDPNSKEIPISKSQIRP